MFSDGKKKMFGRKLFDEKRLNISKVSRGEGTWLEYKKLLNDEKFTKLNEFTIE